MADQQRLKKPAKEQSRDPETDGIQYNERPHIIALVSDNSCNIKTTEERNKLNPLIKHICAKQLLQRDEQMKNLLFVFAQAGIEEEN